MEVTHSIETVCGPVANDELGWTLAHEHFFTETYNSPGMYLADPQIARLELADAAQVGTQTVIDLTTLDMGRDPQSLRALSRDTGVNIIMGTGWYTQATYPEWINSTPTNELAQILINDIHDGVDGVRPGVIGEIGIASSTLDAREERVLRAVGRTHVATNLTIFIHQQRTFSGPLALQVLTEEGVSPHRIVFCHMDSIEAKTVHTDASSMGVWLSYDRLQGWDLVHQLQPWEVERRLDLLLTARREGYLDRILLSTDCCVKGDLRRYGGPGYVFTHGDFARLLSDHGFSDGELDQLFSSNPRRALTGCA